MLTIRDHHKYGYKAEITYWIKFKNGFLEEHSLAVIKEIEHQLSKNYDAIHSVKIDTNYNKRIDADAKVTIKVKVEDTIIKQIISEIQRKNTMYICLDTKYEKEVKKKDIEVFYRYHKDNWEIIKQDLTKEPLSESYQ